MAIERKAPDIWLVQCEAVPIVCLGSSTKRKATQTYTRDSASCEAVSA